MTKNVDRRQFLRLSAGSAAGALLAACGGQTAEQTTQPTAGAGASAATNAPAAAATAEAPAGATAEAPAGATSAPAAAGGADAGGLAFKGNAEFWDWAAKGDARFDAVNQLVTDWQGEHPGITLDYKSFGYDDMQTKLLTAASAGKGPPFSNVHNFWRPELERAGLLVPYPDDMFDWDKLISTPFNRNPQTGKIYTSDFALYTDQVYYHTPLLEAEGIKPADIPRTWEDYMKMMQQLTKRDASGKLIQAGWAFNHYYSQEWLWATLVYQGGGWLWSADGTKALWNEDAGVQALQFIQDVFHKYKVNDPDFLGMFDAWGTRKAATYISQGYTGGGINTDYPDYVGHWGTAVTPTFSGKPGPAWGLVTPEEGFAVFTSAPPDVQQVGFSFIKKMMGSDENRVKWALISNGPPDNKDLFDDPVLKAGDAKKGNSIATQAETLPWRINYGERPLEAEKIWRSMFDAVILDKTAPKEALDEATDLMNAALKQSGKQRVFTERNYKPPA
ncbi:MAG: extracellular solute-binding protein [Roseiflexaceae bacterium]